MSDLNTPATLTATLIQALSQSQALASQLDEQTRAIQRLQEENEQLRRQPRSTEQTEAQPDVSDQIDRLFRQDVEKQAEIDLLKKKLRSLQAKERKWRAQNPLFTSPVVSSDDANNTSSPPAYPTPPHIINTKSLPPRSSLLVQVASSPPRKRPRLSDKALQETTNVQPASKGRNRSKHDIDAISLVAEDGETHGGADGITRRPENGGGNKPRDATSYGRLGALLDNPAPSHSALSKPEMRPKSASPRPTEIARVPSLQKSSSDVSKGESSLRTGPRFKAPGPRHRPEQSGAPEDEEPLRARPVTMLTLSHFKPNPKFNHLTDSAFQGTRRGDQSKCLEGCVCLRCRGGPMNGLDVALRRDMSDDDLLLEFLGPGSEDRIKTLTTWARGNLIHEARAKKMVDRIAKLHRDKRPRGGSPVDFWNADMPSSQEEQKYRDSLRAQEREEVERRRAEALKEDGHWLFADEA